MVVNGEGVYGRILGKNLPCAVAIVQIQVDDQDPAVESLRSLPGNGGGNIVEHAEPRPGVSAGMVESATQIHRDSPPDRQRLVGGGESAPDNTAEYRESPLLLTVVEAITQDTD